MGIGLLCRAGLRQPQSALRPAWEGKSGATPPKLRRLHDQEIREVPPPNNLPRTPFRLKPVLRAQRSEPRLQRDRSLPGCSRPRPPSYDILLAQVSRQDWKPLLTDRFHATGTWQDKITRSYVAANQLPAKGPVFTDDFNPVDRIIARGLLE